VSIPKASIDVFGKPCRFKVFQGFAVPPLIDFYGDQFASGFAECPCDPNPGVPGGCSDLKRSGVIIFENDVMESLPIDGRHIHISPSPVVRVEKIFNLIVEVLGIRPDRGARKGSDKNQRGSQE